MGHRPENFTGKNTPAADANFFSEFSATVSIAVRNAFKSCLSNLNPSGIDLIVSAILSN